MDINHPQSLFKKPGTQQGFTGGAQTVAFVLLTYTGVLTKSEVFACRFTTVTVNESTHLLTESWGLRFVAHPNLGRKLNSQEKWGRIAPGCLCLVLFLARAGNYGAGLDAPLGRESAC